MSCTSHVFAVVSPAPWVALSTGALIPGDLGRGGIQTLRLGRRIFTDTPLLPLQGSGGTAGPPGERGRTGPLGRKVCLDKGGAGFWRSGPASPPGSLSLICQPVYLLHLHIPLPPLWSFPPSLPVESRLTTRKHMAHAQGVGFLVAGTCQQL